MYLCIHNNKAFIGKGLNPLIQNEPLIKGANELAPLIPPMCTLYRNRHHCFVACNCKEMLEIIISNKTHAKVTLDIIKEMHIDSLSLLLYKNQIFG